MDYEVCSLIVNAVIAITAIIGIRQSYKSYVQSNKNVVEQMRFQQQPYIKLCEKITLTSGTGVLIKNIGTGPAIAIQKFVRITEMENSFFDCLHHSVPSRIDTLGVNEEITISIDTSFNFTKAFIDIQSETSGKKMHSIVAFIYKDLFNNYYFTEFKVLSFQNKTHLKFDTEQRMLIPHEIEIIKSLLK